MTFRNGLRIRITHPEHPALGKTGTVTRLCRADDAAWVNMDEPLPVDLRHFPEGDERRDHLLLYPDEVEGI